MDKQQKKREDLVPGVGGGKSSGAFSLIVARVAIIFQVLLFFSKCEGTANESHILFFFIKTNLI